GISLALLPGDERADAELSQLSTLAPEPRERLWRFLAEGGPDNAREFLRYAATLLGRAGEWREPRPLLRAGLYWPGEPLPDLAAIRRHWQAEAPVAALIFYRALVQAADLAPIDALIAALAARGLNPLPLFVQSLRDAQAQAILAESIAAAKPEIVLNATGFSVASPGGPAAPSFAGDCPVLQAILASGSFERWCEGTRGLDPRDVAMAVALPEVDGRIVTRAISFKAEAERDPLTEADLQRHFPVADRVAFVAELARNWVRLRRTPAAERRIALVLANYPNRNGRIGNGVGLDTPASVIAILRALAAAGYRVGDIPADGDALMRALLAGPTNARTHWGREAEESFSCASYNAYLASLPRALQERVSARWGAPERDPFFRPGELDCGSFALPALRFGNVAVAIQPARGYNLDPLASQHDPALVPPHGYLAFHAWLMDGLRAHAVVHVGKHGNLEWLPGKAVALSAECFPEAALGPLPHLYPFIVNDPGEGTQAKRRAQAVIVDHLTPPLTRAGSYGAPAELERLVDEYFAAISGDPRRVKPLALRILDTARASGIAEECGIGAGETVETALPKLDGYLCEIKERQIRGGLHVFGASPVGEDRTDLVLALARLPRGTRPEDDSLLRALAGDLGLGFDPLDADLAAAWTGPRPAALASETPWRSTGDTVERLEALARALVAGTVSAEADWPRTQAVLEEIGARLAPALAASGPAEIEGLLRGLAGRFVLPGPSGAPSRGRPEVLPTGRNFYSVDPRALPSQLAWEVGQRLADALLDRHRDETGRLPEMVGLVAWGTSAMRTQGDDLAEVFALLGVRPVWHPESQRVTGIEVIPLDELGRPRIDVTVRISGFFRDAFPHLLGLLDEAVATVAALDEPPEQNFVAAHARADAERLAAELGGEPAWRRATTRVFGSKPGTYGAGLLQILDARDWRDEGDLAEVYEAWGGYAYGRGLDGMPAGEAMRDCYARIEIAVKNVDTREHDILDSDDYYQYHGGMVATVKAITGREPAAFLGDSSDPSRVVTRSLVEET
ncbi:MAG TPA: cobaltochelatase subunit CobN, partial [Stellaceae bacterium]|nr:cobaltochelatase subunit CobN [Stellaceae bacterium]